MTAVPIEVGQVGIGDSFRHGHGGHHFPYGVSDKDATYSAASRSDAANAASFSRSEAASAVETRDLAKGISDGVAVTGDRVAGIGHQVCEVGKDTAKDICDLERDVLESKHSIAKDIAAASYAGATATQLWGQTNQNNTTAGFAAVNLAVEKVAAAGILEAVRNAGAAALAAATNTAAILAAQEKCCCELRTAIAEDGEKTRGLVQQIDRERLQARLATLEARLPLAAV